jgi:TonB family protein
MVAVPLRRDDADFESLKPGIPNPEGSLSVPRDDIAQLASRLAEQGIQSSELVLDLLLHDLAEEARLAVSADGAAIALDRDDELVCRAAAGSTAPDLGIRLNTRSGLSGMCLREGLPQLCRDSEDDERVDAAACRELGVRAIAVVPVFSGDNIIGVVQVFSGQPDAFSANDLNKLQEFAALVADTLRKSQQEVPASTPPAREVTPPQEPLSIAAIMKKAAPHEPGMRALRSLVIGLAILVAVLLGFDIGWHRARATKPLPLTLDTIPSPEDLPNQSPAKNSTGAVAATAQPRAKRATKQASESLNSQGGLIISQNGKIVYRQGPAAARTDAPGGSENALESDLVPQAIATSSSTPGLSSGITEGRLIHNVQPAYPAQAIEQHVQGPVLLHGTVGTDGVIHELAVVSGDPILSSAARQAVEQWRYEPYRRDGAPIPVPIDITIDFKLPR